MERLEVDVAAHHNEQWTIFSELATSGDGARHYAVDRIRFVMTVYRQWIRYSLKKQDEEGDEDTVGILDVVDHALPGNYSFTDLLIDFNRILRDPFAGGGGGGCSESDCFILRRHERPKVREFI